MADRQKNIFLLKSLAVIYLLGVPLLAIGQSEGQEDSLVLEEVLVTAMRRGEQNVLDVPLAITAFRGDWLENRGFVGLDDFLQLSPGASMVQGIPGFSRIQMRGISSGVGEAQVGYYLDEVPMAYINQSLIPDMRSFDLERVEILRGPQGTLYGAGAIAGVVRTVTMDPALDAFGFKGDASISSTKSGGTNYDANFALNVPIVKDRLAIRAVYMQEDTSGWIDQTLLGKKNYNKSDIKNFRFKVLGEVTDRLSISAMIWGSRTDTYSLSSSFDDLTNNEAAETPSKFDYDIYNLTINYSGDSFGFVSATSYMELDTVLVSDFLFGFTLESILDPATWTQEFRFFSTYDGPWQWTAGAYYRDADQTQIQDSAVLPLFGLDPVIQYDKVEAWNVFAEITGTFLDDRLDVTFGARYLEETRTSEQRVRPSEPFENEFDDVTPRFNITYRPADNWMTYFNWGQGFRSGINQFALSLEAAAALGVILPSAASPETVDSYEAGIKGEFLDGRLTVDGSIFMIKWKDLQTIVPVVAGVLSGVVNASKAESPGAEIAIQYQVSDGFMFGLMASYNDAQIVGDVYAEATTLDPVTGLPTGETVPILVFEDGDRLNDVPEWTFGATLDFFHPLANGYSIVANASAQYASEREVRSFGNVAVGDNMFTLGGRIGVDMGRWGVFLFANNITNDTGMVSPSLQKVDFGTRYRPRTIGVNVKFAY